MASQYLGLNRGQDGSDDNSQYVVSGTSTGSTDIELRIDLTKSLTREDVNLLTAKLLRFVNDGRTTFLKL